MPEAKYMRWCQGIPNSNDLVFLQVIAMACQLSKARADLWVQVSSGEQITEMAPLEYRLNDKVKDVLLQMSIHS